MIPDITNAFAFGDLIQQVFAAGETDHQFSEQAAAGDIIQFLRSQLVLINLGLIGFVHFIFFHVHSLSVWQLSLTSCMKHRRSAGDAPGVSKASLFIMLYVRERKVSQVSRMREQNFAFDID